MAKLFIEDTSLTAIGDAIRAKTGTTELLSPSGMATAIEGIEAGGGGGGGELPEEALVVTKNCGYRFSNNGWNWFLTNYSNKIVTQDITNATNMFAQSSDLTKVSLDFNFKEDQKCACNSMFSGCTWLEEITGTFYNLYPSDISSMFNGCRKLKQLPTFENLDLSFIQNASSNIVNNIFASCASLRSIPEFWMKNLKTPNLTAYYYAGFNAYNGLAAIDELIGVHPHLGGSSAAITSNMFSSSLTGLYRAKNLTFALQDDGTPYTVNWSNQALNLTGIGYGNVSYTYIGTDKLVENAEAYALLKDDPDWYTNMFTYSRYNHDSAVNTINSLPDASAGTGNTIKFKKQMGANTDGGAIENLTEEEIAVAAAKGWTVTLVD